MKEKALNSEVCCSNRGYTGHGVVKYAMKIMIPSLFTKEILAKHLHLVGDVSETVSSGKARREQAVEASLLGSLGPKLAGTCVGTGQGAAHTH